MKWGWLLGIGLAGCAGAPWTFPLHVAYWASAPCEDPAGALLEIRDRYGVREFILMEAHCSSKCVSIGRGGCFPVESREQVGRLLVSDERVKRWAEAEVEGHRYYIHKGKLETWSRGEEARRFVAGAERVLRIVGSGPPRWTMQLMGPQVGGPRLLGYLEESGLNDVRKAGAGDEEAVGEPLPVESVLGPPGVTFLARSEGASARLSWNLSGGRLLGQVLLRTHRGEDLFRLWDFWSDVLATAASSESSP
jgi:hypothetical protein